MLRTELYADPHDLFLHDLVLDSCRRNPRKTALVDASCGRRMTYAEYGDTVESLARGLIAAGVKPGDVVAIFLRELLGVLRRVPRHPARRSDSYAAESHLPRARSPISTGKLRRRVLITDGAKPRRINLAGPPNLRRVYTTRQHAPAPNHSRTCCSPPRQRFPRPISPRNRRSPRFPTPAAPPDFPRASCSRTTTWSRTSISCSGRTRRTLNAADTILCCLPLYHIYGLNVILNPALILGATLVLVPRFNVRNFTQLLVEEGITMMPLVPPAINALCQAAEAGQFPRDHKVHWVKSGRRAAGSRTCRAALPRSPAFWFARDTA